MSPGREQDKYGEDQIAALLRELIEPPRAWIEAAARLPAARSQLDEIVARAEKDAAYRDQVLAGLEGALRDAGHEPEPHLVAVLRTRLTLDP